MANYISENPEFIVQGFICFGISAALDAINEDGNEDIREINSLAMMMIVMEMMTVIMMRVMMRMKLMMRVKMIRMMMMRKK